MGTQTQRLRDERGFSLIEILVVIIVIGILTAIVLPIFLRQSEKGDDASAKSNARGLAGSVETCFASTTDYTECDSAAELDFAGIPLGSGPGEVEIVFATTAAYEVRAESKHGSTFTWNRNGGTVVRSCTPPGEGDCSTAGEW